MTNLREAAQMALDALELVDGYVMGKHEAKEALYEALAQPEQKPVAWRKKWEGDEDYTYYWMNRYKGSEPLYTAPPQREWQGLTDDDFIGLTTPQIFAMKFAEAKLREKNA